MTTQPARWAILGPGTISASFAVGLTHARYGVLHAVGSRDAARARAFAAAHGAPVAGTYDDILARADVDAVYIGTVHTTHELLARAALEAGKAVLCEKPLTVSVEDTRALCALATARERPLVEAFKYRFGPFPQLLRDVIAGGELGEIVELRTQLGFDAGVREGRLFDPATAGGAILDVGCYPVSLAVGVAAWTGRLAAPRIVEADGVVGQVDERARAVIDLDGLVAHVEASITQDMPRTTTIRGTAAELTIPNVWGSRTESASAATLRRADGTAAQLTAPTVNPMASEADATILALREGRSEAPEMPWAQTLAVAQLLDDWRAELDAA